jgi:preprotein translocase subunit SecD
MRKGSRLLSFLILVAIILGVAATTTARLWHHIVLGLDLQGGFDVLYQIGNGKQPVSSDAVQATVAALMRRANALGVAEPVIEVEGKDRVRVELAGVKDPNEARTILGKPAKLEFVTEDGKVVMTGQDLESNAQYQPNPTTNAPEVAIQFKDPTKFAKITQDNLGKRLAIVLDGKIIDAPVVQSVIPNGQAVITGLPSPAAATELAKLLNAGALPYPLTELSSMTVGPSLGMAALHQTLLAAAAAVALIFLFMIVVYRIPGLIAVISLVAYMWLILGVFVGLKVTLTLPGLAALVLGVGMAVDANIITYERIKDEYRNGKSLLSSFVSGSRNAFRTIVDSNATTMIAGIVMYFYGTGTIRGFAVALIISIILSLLTAVAISRLLLNLLIKSNALRKPWWFGLKGGAAK